MTVRRRGRDVPLQTKKRSCDGKIRYATSQLATDALYRKVRELGSSVDAINSYKCKFGDRNH